MKRRIAIAATALLVLALVLSAIGGCASKPDGEAKSELGEGMYDVNQFYVHKNPRNGEESYYFLVASNEGDLQTFRVAKKSVTENKTKQSSYISVRKSKITFFKHDEALAKPDLPANEAYDKRFTPPPPAQVQPAAPAEENEASEIVEEEPEEESYDEE